MSELFVLLLAGIIVPPLTLTAAIMRLTDKIIAVRDKIAGILGLEDLYY